MGTTCLVRWKDANGQPALTQLSDKLVKQFHATMLGKWSVVWKIYRESTMAKLATPKCLHLVTVQGGSTVNGIPVGSQAAAVGNRPVSQVTAGAAGGGGGGGGGGVGAGVGIGGIGGLAGLNALAGGAAGQGAKQTATNYNQVQGQGQGSAESTSLDSWCIIETDPAGVEDATKRQLVLVEVEKDMELLLAKLKNLWASRQHAQVEGYVFDMGDFIVRAGSLNIASAYRGMLIEVEYLPQTTSVAASNAILKEFVQLISPPNTNLFTPDVLDNPYEQVGLDPNSWSSLHSALQFMTLFRRQRLL